jgi:hypothetical protein
LSNCFSFQGESRRNITEPANLILDPAVLERTQEFVKELIVFCKVLTVRYFTPDVLDKLSTSGKTCKARRVKLDLTPRPSYFLNTMLKPSITSNLFKVKLEENMTSYKFLNLEVQSDFQEGVRTKPFEPKIQTCLTGCKKF